MQPTNKTALYIEWLKYFIFYIPCILISVIVYFINDAKNTNKTIYILFIILLIFSVLYVIIPIIQKALYKYDGILLISRKKYLNKSVLTLSLKELNDKITNSQTLINYAINPEGFESLSDSDLIVHIPNILDDVTSTDKKYIKDTDNNIKMFVEKYKNEPDKIKQYLNNQKQSFLSKLYYSIIKFNNQYFLTDSISEASLLTQHNSKLLHTYHYGMSFWLYLDTNILTEQNRDAALILSLGSRPSIYYDYNNKELIVEIKDFVKNQGYKQIRIYNSNKILFQKWNHVVMNYVNGQFDLFINNILVCTQPNITPYINNTDVLQIGSIKNSDLGGISNLKYYNQPISLYKIEQIYNEQKISAL